MYEKLFTPLATIVKPGGNPVAVGKPVEFVTVNDIGVIGAPKQTVDEAVEPGENPISGFAATSIDPVTTAVVQS